MAQLTARQVAELGDVYLQLAQALGNYRIEKRMEFTKVQNQQLKEAHWSLLEHADKFYTGSVKLVMEEATEAINKIKSITAEINRTYQKLKNFQKAIDIAAAAITLAESIFSKNILAINKTIDRLSTSIK